MSVPGTESDQAAEELRLLALGLLDRAEPAVRTLLAGLRERVEQAPDAAEHSAACTWCPLCTTVGLLRGERPELAAAIVQHADGFVAALRAILTPPATDQASSAGPASSAGLADRPPEPPPVQHIEVRRAGEAGAGC
jgi:hypothetical protein